MIEIIPYLLAGLLWFKLFNHYKYYSELHFGNTDKDMKDFLFDITDNQDGVWQGFFTLLKFSMPIFQREFLDTDEENYVIYRKRINLILLIWWVLAIIWVLDSMSKYF